MSYYCFYPETVYFFMFCMNLILAFYDLLDHKDSPFPDPALTVCFQSEV